ncbi:hypothetical protein DFP80_101184 [Marinomonas rhizomae]|uniref:Uncharacterized protein n=1 Tax=Marinomonas rhizomae TaxID=491948 RepID=A0A366JGX4_9GAMM|nr:hypothetical protein DFP80_101184 [Marinomonas rhizomae]
MTVCKRHRSVDLIRVSLLILDTFRQSICERNYTNLLITNKTKADLFLV